MMLKELTIVRRDYWDEKCNSPLVGKIKFKSVSGEVQINLTEDAAKKILGIVAEGIVAASQEVAQRLTASVLTQTSSGILEHRADLQS